MLKSIIKRIKRFFFRLKNSDPFYHCPVWKNEGCSHIDGLICDFPLCDIYREYRESKDSNFVGCVACVFNQECCSKQFGLGCNKGKISK